MSKNLYKVNHRVTFENDVYVWADEEHRKNEASHVETVLDLPEETCLKLPHEGNCADWELPKELEECGKGEDNEP